MSKNRQIIEEQQRGFESVYLSGSSSRYGSDKSHDTLVVCERRKQLDAYKDFRFRKSLLEQVDCSLEQVKVVSFDRFLRTHGTQLDRTEQHLGLIVISGDQKVTDILPSLRKFNLKPTHVVLKSLVVRTYPPYANNDYKERSLTLLSLLGKYRLTRLSIALGLIRSQIDT